MKEQVEELQADGNYRAAMSYVRKLEEARVFSMLAIEIEVGPKSATTNKICRKTDIMKHDIIL